jgi:5'-nucleotidase
MLTIAVSSRSLFHLEKENEIFEEQGQEAYDRHMEDNENVVLQPGGAFSLVQKMLALNTPGAKERDRVEVVLLSRNSAGSSVRIMKSIRAHGLAIDQAVFTSGENRFRYAQEYGADLFLSATGNDTRKALENGIASATILTGERPLGQKDDVVRIAFDGDAVIFSDESDKVFRAKGLESFIAHEKEKENIPLGEGPFKRLIHKLFDLRASLPKDQEGGVPLRLGLVTARGLESSGRVMTTLKEWGLSLDELVFAGGADKGPLLAAMGADFFFDDTGHNLKSAHEHNIASAQVPFGAGGIVAYKHTSADGAEHKHAPATPPQAPQSASVAAPGTMGYGMLKVASKEQIIRRDRVNRP